MSTNFFSSLSGQFDYNASMSSLLGDYNTIKSGAYGSLMKSYVGKVGNKAALKAYQETGSTTTGSDTATQTGSKKSVSKSNFLDSYFSEKSKAATSTKKTETSAAAADTSKDAAASTTSAADKYAKYKSSWLDDQLKQYDKDANKTTAADTSVSMDTTI